MKEKNIHNLKKAINDLPTLKPSEKVWSNIHSEILYSNELNRNNLDKALKELPVLISPENTWNNILEKTEKSKNKIIHIRYLSGIAVAVILLCVFFMKINIKVKEELNISTETINHEAIYDMECEPNMDAIKFIDNYCKSLPSSCTNSQLMDYRTELEILYEKEKQLCLKINQFKSNDNLKKYHALVTIKIDDITKEMINIIMSKKCSTSQEI